LERTEGNKYIPNQNLVHFCHSAWSSVTNLLR